MRLPVCWSGVLPAACLRGRLPNANTQNISWPRRFKNHLALGTIATAALIVTAPLFVIMRTIIYRGFGGLGVYFFTILPKPIDVTAGGTAKAMCVTLSI